MTCALSSSTIRSRAIGAGFMTAAGPAPRDGGRSIWRSDRTAKRSFSVGSRRIGPLRRGRHELHLHRHSHKLRERARGGLFHDTCAIDLDGALAQAQFAGHDLVCMPSDEQCEYIAFACRERVEPFGNVIALVQGSAIASVVLESVAYAGQQRLVGHRLL